jgi:hypothetical protein
VSEDASYIFGETLSVNGGYTWIDCLANRVVTEPPMKIAIFDVSHWHFPLYLAPLRDPGIEVVGISDTASFAGVRFAATEL